MRIVLFAALSLLATFVLLPTASADGPGPVCSELTSPYWCWGQFVCIGYSTDGQHYWCKYSIEDPCHTTVTCATPDP